MAGEEEWRFLYEALLHISSIRLLLTKQSVSPILHCAKLKAGLDFSSSLELVCEWEQQDSVQGSKRCILRIPMPLCPLDHTAMPVAVARVDHIEVKLKLINCARFNLFQLGNESLTSSTKPLSSLPSLSCRTCKSNITKGAFSSMIELPSVDWREATDDWFGVCCCGPNIRTETLVADFEKRIFLSQGKILLASTTCIVHFDDLREGVLHIPSQQRGCVEEQDPRNSFYEFLKGPVRPPSNGTWQALHCKMCSSPIGSYINATEHGVHLFKRHIYEEPFRTNTLTKDLTKHILSQIEHNSEYRYILRGLGHKKAMVRLVVINEKSLVFTDTMLNSRISGFEPVITAMFQDCSASNEKENQIVEGWCSKYKVDEIYMLEEEIPLLLKTLCENETLFPASCCVMQDFKLTLIHY